MSETRAQRLTRKDIMMIEDLMKAADAGLDEATKETLEPDQLTLHQQRRRIEKLERERDEWRERCKKLVIENIGLQR